MSEKLITMKEYNGSSYDDLYPKNISGQVYLDATAQGVLNLPSGKTVNDAFSAMSNGGAFNVGDILVTSRTDLDDRWLLCNGSVASGTEYPELKNLLVNTPHKINARAIPTKIIYNNYNLTPLRLGKPGEILYCNSNGYLASYNFNTNTTTTSTFALNPRTAGSYGNGVFDYIPSADIYVAVPNVGDSTPVHNTVAYYSSSLEDLSASSSSSTMSINNYYAGAFTTKGQSFIFTRYTSGSASDGFSSFVYKFNSVGNFSVMSGARMQSLTSNIGGYYSWMYNIGDDNTYAACGGTIVNIVDSSGALIKTHTVTGGANHFASDGSVVISQNGINGNSYKITKTGISSLTNVGAYIFGSDNHGFFYLLNNKLYNSTDHGSSWSVVDNNAGNTDLYSIIDSPEENKVYVLGYTKTVILDYANQNSVLPTWTPADGLYAYIKAKK